MTLKFQLRLRLTEGQGNDDVTDTSWVDRRASGVAFSDSDVANAREAYGTVNELPLEIVTFAAFSGIRSWPLGCQKIAASGGRWTTASKSEGV